MTERRHFNDGERREVYLRARGNCERCRNELDDGWEVDHIVAFSRGGPTDLDNAQALCMPCNRKKANKG